MKDNKFDVDKLLNNIFKPSQSETLKDLFERRVEELKIPITSVTKILKIEHRALYGILNGTQKRIDFSNLVMISNFLQVPKEKVIQLYVEAIEKTFNELAVSTENIEFIKQNFDLVALRKVGIIDSITDFEHIENKLKSFLGLNNILHYQRPSLDVAFSAGIIKPKNELNRSLFIYGAIQCFEQINNPNEYSRESLFKFFPQIRWHSTNVEQGLKEVIKHLYKLGVTVLYLPSLPSLHLRGATFSVNDKPCIILTNYAGFYPTLWFALIHELFHVLFDWDEIMANNYHLSDEQTDLMSVTEKEQEADNFSRDYLFSKEKTQRIKPFINNDVAVNEFAKSNDIHSSFIYVFYAWDYGKTDRLAWGRARKKSPPVELSINSIYVPWDKANLIADSATISKKTIYN